MDFFDMRCLKKTYVAAFTFGCIMLFFFYTNVLNHLNLYRGKEKFINNVINNTSNSVNVKVANNSADYDIIMNNSNDFLDEYNNSILTERGKESRENNANEIIRFREKKCNNRFPCYFALVADLDKKSLGINEENEKTKSKSLTFKSFVLFGLLTKEKGNYVIIFDNKEKEIKSELNEGGRGMELSELIVFNQKLLTFDDRTGIVFEINLNYENKKAIPSLSLTNDKSFPFLSFPVSATHPSFSFLNFPSCDLSSTSTCLSVRPYLILSENLQSSKGMKVEWATNKNKSLIVGSFGKEYTDSEGRILHNNNMYICIIDKNGRISREYWSDKYNKIRKVLHAEYPNGYVIHEAVNWSYIHQKWFFLPRRISHEKYDEKKDETKGSNIMILCNEDFSSIEVVEIKTKKKHERRGFSSFKFIPGTKHFEIIAIKTEENEKLGIQKSHLTIFTVRGDVLLDDIEIPNFYKYEGIEFI